MRAMVYIGFIFAVAILCAALSSCVSYDTTYHNAAGQQYYCKGNGWGLIGAAISLQREAECDKAAKRAGYEM